MEVSCRSTGCTGQSARRGRRCCRCGLLHGGRLGVCACARTHSPGCRGFRRSGRALGVAFFVVCGWLGAAGTVRLSRSIIRGGSWGCNGGGGRGTRGRGVASRSVLDDGEPFLGVGGGMGLELQFGGGVEGIANPVAGNILALDAEFGAVSGADHTVWEEQRELRGGVAAEVVVVFEFVQVARGGDDVVARAVALDDSAGATLQRALNERLGGLVVLIGEVNVGQ